MRFSIMAAVSAAALCVSAPASADVIETSDNGFVTRDETVVAATPKETWLALISPAGWWNSQHTWSANAANLRLTPQAGGCFCETIPEQVTEDSFTLEGSVEHMRVIQAYPERALRMVGALGPLQSEPVTGVLTIALTEVDTPEGMGTRIVWEYNVGGSMRYEVPVISRAVDGVMSLQLAGLAQLLGEIEDPGEAGDGIEEGAAADAAEPDEERVESAGLAPVSDAASDAGENADEAPAEEGPDEPQTVDEAFDDLGDFDLSDEDGGSETGAKDPPKDAPPVATDRP